MPLNVSEWGLNMIRFISNFYGGLFLYRPGPVISTCMLEKNVLVTPTLPRGKNRVAPVGKNRGPKQWCSKVNTLY